MKLDVTDVEILSLDTGVIDCPITAEKVAVLFMTIRMVGQPPINLAIRNPHRLAKDLPVVMAQSRVLSGDGTFVPAHEEDGQ
ncbi:MAG: hypothetical protein KF774_18275 [Planctomyces sp.]|nr:hypothetical protein [Planctomyces sp.]